MQTTKYIWKNGKLISWEEASTHLLTHTLHYGGGAFEGIRAYKTERGTAIFRLREHMERFAYSASALNMEMPFTTQALIDAVVQTVRENKLEQGYIRPLVYYGYGVMGLKPFGAPVDIIVACWPWGAYLSHDLIDVKISKYIRIHEKSTIVDAKLCGHYVNSMLASLELKGTKYHEALLLDAQGRIAEGPGENFFMVQGGKILTPKPGTILPGITRNTVFQIAQKLGIQVIEQDIYPKDLASADEAFFTGTAAEVVPIGTIDDKPIGAGKVGPIASKIKSTYLDIVYGRNREFERFLHYV